METGRIQRHVLAAFLAVASAMVSSRATAEEKVKERQWLFEAKVYQVLTSITGAGLTSQTLPGMNGWFQIIHERLDDTELVMDGTTFTWNGRPEPENPRIIRLSTPAVTALEGDGASINIGSISSPQYMEKRSDGLFELKESAIEDIGVLLSLTPVGMPKEGILDCDISFKYTWVKEREKIEGVNLEVGHPVYGRASVAGKAQTRVNEWSCCQISAESEGWIFLFLRARPIDAEELQKTEKQAAQEKELGPTQGEAHPDKGPESGGPKVQIGGSVEVRGGMWKGGGK